MVSPSKSVVPSQASGRSELGFWHELNGVEILFASTPSPVTQSDVDVRLRFRVEQIDPATTRLRAKLWPLGNPEPADWSFEALDTAPALQGVAGSIAFDVYNYFGTAHVFFDDVVVTSLD